MAIFHTSIANVRPSWKWFPWRNPLFSLSWHSPHPLLLAPCNRNGYPLIADAKWLEEWEEMAVIILFTRNLCTKKTLHLFSVFSHYASGAAPGTKLNKPFITACNCFCSASDSNSSLVWCLENKRQKPTTKKDSDFNMPKCYRFILSIIKVEFGCYLGCKPHSILLHEKEA